MDNLIILSHPTFGATAAATYRFVTSEYKPPLQDRYIKTDIVKNQNGKFKYIYDNGPGFDKFQPFNIHCEQAFATELGATAGMQYARLKEMWDYRGILGLQGPDGVHQVHWAGDHERAFRVFPARSNSPLEFTVVVQFEGAS